MRDQKSISKTKPLVDSNLAADLSQQIVKNMDQELQYLKHLTSSNARTGNQSSMISSPDSTLFGKRRIETDPGHQTFNTYENFNKVYKPDPLLGINFFSSNIKSEGGDITQEE